MYLLNVVINTNDLFLGDFIYLGNFNAPVLFLGLVRSRVVVSGTVVIHQFPVPLSYAGLNEKKEKNRKQGNEYVLFSVSICSEVPSAHAS